MSKIRDRLHLLSGKRLLLAGLVVAALAATAIPQVVASSGAPLLYMPLSERNFGDVFVGEDLEQVFPIRNDGDAALQIENKTLTSVLPSTTPSSMARRAVRASAFYRERAAGFAEGVAPMPASMAGPPVAAMTRRAAPV